MGKEAPSSKAAQLDKSYQRGGNYSVVMASSRGRAKPPYCPQCIRSK
jgi:hypothetical protein